ncbi:unnamed protein product [Lactuca saligna]|uniref:Uncharacterized protein n=1 Tax=Lactuca saligna TaxID=75948 RepID=A0AA35YC32_LACSI|nr:unnamed protein product [Lactuca saligna]
MWKEEFFFVHYSAFSRLIKFGDSIETGLEPVPDSTNKERDIVEYLSANFVKWFSPDETMLWMDGLTSYWNKLGKQQVQKVAGKFVNILDRFIGSGLMDLLNLLRIR